MESVVVSARIENGLITPLTEIFQQGLVEIKIRKPKSVVDETFGIWKDEKTGVDYVNEIRGEWKKGLVEGC